MGWAALGGFEAVLVDNGGPYRSRMNTIAAVVFGGALCGAIGSLVPLPVTAFTLAFAAVVTALVCFAVTFARVVSQPIASTSVIILVLYFAGYGSGHPGLAATFANVLSYMLGGLWAAVLSLFLWPIDPFRPARQEVASCYDLLAQYTTRIGTAHTEGPHAAHDDDHSRSIDHKRELRAQLESARAALSVSAARAPARTLRARNLSVLLETADMLFAVTVRLTELSEMTTSARIPEMAHWLSAAEAALALNLRTHPADNAASFGPGGSHRLQHITRYARQLALTAPPASAEPDPLPGYLIAEQRDALQNLEVAFEAVCAVWTGIETRTDHRADAETGTADGAASARQGGDVGAWFDALQENFALDSIMMRHALRMAVVGAVDVLLLRVIHVSHGFWLGMTSIIVLQPYGSGTLRKGVQRVGGTVGGGILAACLAAAIHSYVGILAVISVCSILTLATYAVDYGWYSFFLTPTFVLMSLPHLRDWRYAGIRIVTTLVGALTAVLAMRLLWPQSLTVEMRRLLARAASAAAAYLRAVVAFWSLQPPGQGAASDAQAERRLLAPARRGCGLASQDAEEALDRILLDSLPGIRGPRTLPSTESALTFTTYIRRFTQCLTTLAFVGRPTAETLPRIRQLIQRMEAMARSLATPAGHESSPVLEPFAASAEPDRGDRTSELAEQMLQRMERQAGVLERAAASFAVRADAHGIESSPSPQPQSR